jgi:DnaJ-class molecular chaperone
VPKGGMMTEAHDATCPNCEGMGSVYTPDDSQYDADTTWEHEDCPVCWGRGLIRVASTAPQNDDLPTP